MKKLLAILAMFAAIFTASAQTFQTFRVTSLVDSGPGSLRDCVSFPDRVCVFEVGGRIQLAAQFNVTVGQKVLAQALPILGSVGGAVINAAFTEHFSMVARYHFGIRRLERRYGREEVEATYKAAIGKTTVVP